MTDNTSPGADLVTGARIVYDGGRNVQYDLTAADPRFKKDDEFLIVFQAGQIHTFKIPVYVQDNTTGEQLLHIYKLSDDGTAAQELVRGEDWEMVDPDNEAIAQAYLIDADAANPFNKVLTRQIILNCYVAERVKLKIVSQRFYLDLYDLNGFDGIGPSYTPAFGKYVLDKLQDLEATVVTNLSNNFGIANDDNKWLEEDLTGTKYENFIQDEMHLVETASGIDTLMPARGSFYSHDFRMWKYSVRTGTVQMANKRFNLENQAIFVYQVTSNVGNTTSKVTQTKKVYLTNENYDDYLGMAGSFIDRARMTLMKPDVDYVFENLNAAKTEKSESEYGVYDTVRLIGSMNGNVLITYHAFGGNVVFEDVQDMRQDLTNVMRILTSKNLVTSDIFDKQPIIREMLNRIQVIEQYHRHFNQVEHAVYMGIKGFHWINIASLYDVEWDEENKVIDEIGSFRVESLVRHWCYEFTLSIDLKKKIYNMLRCNTLATNDVGATDLKDYEAYLKIHDDVAIRCCWNGDGTTSGIMLQLGWNFDNYPEPENGVDNDTIVVTDKSGMTSKWRLVYNPLDNVFEGSKSNKVCNHTKYIPTTDTNYVAGKSYYKFEDIYTYFRTASERIKEHVEYYTLVRNALNETSGYVKVNCLPNYMVSDYISERQMATDDSTPPNTISCRNGIFERSLYRKVPKVIDTSTYEVGDVIEDVENVFEVSDGTYTEDDAFELMRPEMYWRDGVPGCHQLRRILEPSDGLMSWFGNMHLDLFNAGTCTVESSLDDYTQEILDIMTIRGMTVKLYDRKYDKILTRTADLGYTHAEYAPATGTAQTGVVYYEKLGDTYFRSIIAVGEELTEGKYFTKRREDSAVGQIIFDLVDMCGAEFVIFKDIDTGRVTFSFDVYLGTDSAINRRFDLRQIDLHF